MSTNYAISSFIKLDDIKALSKIYAIDEVKINHINEMGQSLNFIRDRAGNYLCFYLHNMVGSTVIAPKDQRKYVTSFDRFGSNNVQLILDIIEQECQVQIIPEHEDSYDSISKNSYENFKNKDKPKLKTFKFTRTQTIVDHQTIKALTLEEAEDQLQLENWTDEEIHLSEFDYSNVSEEL